MKMKYLIFTTVFALLSVGCSDKKEETQEQQTTINANLKKAKNPKIPLDSSQIVTLKDFDPKDSIMVGVRAFRAAKKEFVKRWNYTKDTHLFMDIVDQICRDVRPCAAMIDSVAYKNDVSFILDSLMRNNLLDSAIENKKQELIEREKGCFGKNKFTESCQKKINEELKKRIREERKVNK
ncbi:hypothetical protein IKQ19_18910 [Candidatus Saccharibacteria bacterium]|nr:hypothetical protein [Candidatus Saccharibacteria bacterium]